MPHRGFLGRLWSALNRRGSGTVRITFAAIVFLGLIGAAVAFAEAEGPLGIHLFAANGKRAKAALVAATPTPPSTPTPNPTITPTPRPTAVPTHAPPSVYPAVFTCASAQTNHATYPGFYVGSLCVHTAPHSAIGIHYTSICGAHGGVLGLYTDASGNWSTLGHWQIYAPACKVPFTIWLTISGTTPNGTPIAGSGSIRVTA